jgi:hypothetical protein
MAQLSFDKIDPIGAQNIGKLHLMVVKAWGNWKSIVYKGIRMITS